MTSRPNAQRLKQLARDHFYDNVPFHRVIDGFMAQTGDGQYGNGTGGSKYPALNAEFSSAPYTRGIVGMARKSDPNSANSQFFIMFADVPSSTANTPWSARWLAAWTWPTSSSAASLPPVRTRSCTRKSPPI